MTTRPHIAILLSHSTGDAPDHEPLWQEDIVLIHADSLEAARKKAAARGRDQQTSYLNDADETITWHFDQVVDVAAVLDDDLSGDADLYARHFRDVASYRRFEPLLDGEPL